MNAPSTIAPHLSPEQREYMALVAPEDERFDRLATSLLALDIDGKPITGAIAASLAAQIIDKQIEFCECPSLAIDMEARANAWHKRHAWMTEEQVHAFIDWDLMRAYHRYKQDLYAFRRAELQNAQPQEEGICFYYHPDHGAFSPIGDWAA